MEKLLTDEPFNAKKDKISPPNDSVMREEKHVNI